MTTDVDDRARLSDEDGPAARRHRAAMLRERGPADRVLATDYARWPAALKAASPRPLHERRVPPHELVAFVSTWRGRGAGWTWTATPDPVFPKIAVCSFKDWPWLLPYGADVPLDLSGFCSARMRLVLSAWTERDEPAMLRFFPFIDFTAVNEYRFAGERLALTRVTTRHEHDGTAAAQALAARCAGEVAPCLIDVATRREDGHIRAWLVEINPWSGAPE